ncbi:MAG TPA: nucleoside recognition domain-containing protein [Thermoanaerobaculia bacterium]|nr:nucleoside recognition domain-containing protein [Thermoanaerobaculia bacterium]
MLNWIWFGLMAVAFVVAMFRGTAAEVTAGAIESAKVAVEISLGLIGIMALWLGIMRVAEVAGLVQLLSRAIAPVLRVIFPEVPRDHPAMGAIVMNIAANMLGLNNAATPLGIKAMEELQELNPHKDTATNAMVMLMAINTASVQLIPATVIGLMAAAGSTNPTAIISTTLIVTGISLAIAILAAKLLERFFPVRDGAEPAEVSR